MAFLAVVNVAVLVAGGVLVGASFLDIYNLQSMAGQVPELGLLALGVMLAMISGNGGIDLSGIALANLSGVVAYLLLRDTVSPDDAPLLFSWSFAGIALLVGLVGGMLNGFLISSAGLTPIIATLGTQLFFTGLAISFTNGSALGLGFINLLDAFGNTPVLGVPLCSALFLLIALILGGVLRYSPFGLRLLLLGNNAKAARYAGKHCGKAHPVFDLYRLRRACVGRRHRDRRAHIEREVGLRQFLRADRHSIAVMAGVRPEGGYGRVICVVLSATSLQILSSLFNFMDISNFFRDLAWGVLLLVFLRDIRLRREGLVQGIARLIQVPGPARCLRTPVDLSKFEGSLGGMHACHSVNSLPAPSRLEH
ncbi:ABC transporter permease [Ensifer canadensis]